MLPTFERTLDKIGVHTDGFGTTELAGKARLDRALDPEMARLFQLSTERIYRQFLALVSEARDKKDLQEVDRLAQGRVWSGQQAMGNGLVDKLGTFQNAIEASARIAGLDTDYKIDWIEPQKSALDEMFMGFMTAAVTKLNLSVSTPAIGLPVPWLQGMLEDLRYIAAYDGQFTVAAHCLCDLN